MKIFGVVLALILSFGSPAWAKKFAFPQNNPAATVTIPDSWKTKSIEYGFQAKSPDDDVFFSIESTAASNMKKMLDENTAWMKENDIVVTGKPAEKELNLGGLKGQLVVYPAKDGNGETQVTLFFAESGQRLIFMTMWASLDEQKANEKDIDAIIASIKAID